MKEVSSVRITLERYNVGAEHAPRVSATPHVHTLRSPTWKKTYGSRRNSGRIVKGMLPRFSGGGRSRGGLLNLEISSEEPVDSLLRLGCGCEDCPSIVSQDR